METRRRAFRASAWGGVAIVGTLLAAGGARAACTPATTEVFPGTGVFVLDPAAIPQYVGPLPVPGTMPSAGSLLGVKYYEIAVKQFDQQVLPETGCGGVVTEPYPKTTVWSYGKPGAPATFKYPALTVETKADEKVRVKWINGLVDPKGNYLSHLLPIDQTLHWANPPKDCIDGMMRTDCMGQSQDPYTGPVPIVTHVHGAHVFGQSDGYPEAWYLPAARNLPAGTATRGSKYDTVLPAGTGAAIFEYPNDQPPTTLWYHDHTVGMTRANVYAGPAGFWLVRAKAGGPEAALEASLPKGAFEIPVVIQDRTFKPNGSLFYPEKRALFEDLAVPQLQIPFIPDQTVYPDGSTLGQSDISPIWNPEFFGNALVTNGKTWPSLNAQPRTYRFRFLNASGSRFLLLKLVAEGNQAADRPAAAAASFHQIGGDQGFLNLSPVTLDQLLLGPAERADVLVDLSAFAGQTVYLINEGPDEPFGGGTPFSGCATVADPPPGCFEPSNPLTTGQVMKIAVANGAPAPAFDPAGLHLPAVVDVAPNTPPRRVSLNEEESSTVFFGTDAAGNSVLTLPAAGGVAFAPKAAKLGTVDTDPAGNVLLDANGLPETHPLPWMDAITEMPRVGDAEQWEIYNFTEDAHPIHIHLVQFQVVGREPFDMASGLLSGAVRDPEVWESGYKDTVVAYPGEVTRVRAVFDRGGQFVWHCHILEHEDNEMMRPYVIKFDPNFPDLNEDGKVNGVDLALLLKEVALRYDNLAYDLNGDGKVNLQDALALSKKFTR